MGLRAGWLALIVFVWVIGAFLGSTFEYQDTAAASGLSYSTGAATFTNNSATVTGAGTAWVVGMENGLIKLNADNIYCKIFDVVNPTTITLADRYPGTGGAGAYTIQASPGWAGTGSGGYETSPTTKLTYLAQVSNAIQRIGTIGGIPIMTPNPQYFSTLFDMVTWRFSFMTDYQLIYWIVFLPFTVMGIFSFLMLFYGLIRGNLTWG